VFCVLSDLGATTATCRTFYFLFNSKFPSALVQFQNQQCVSYNSFYFNNPKGIIQILLNSVFYTDLIEDTIFGSNYDVYVYSKEAIEFSFPVGSTLLYNFWFFFKLIESANLVMTNYPAQRCHTQPIGSVLLHLGCSNKQLVAHEDYNRPHCGRFFGAWNFDEKKYSTFTFRLQPGKYDPEMLRYWRKRVGSLCQCAVTYNPQLNVYWFSILNEFSFCAGRRFGWCIRTRRGWLGCEIWLR